jgi:hypothetical protein
MIMIKNENEDTDEVYYNGDVVDDKTKNWKGT